MVDQSAVSPADAALSGDSDCAHHWRIETPAGETSQGICKLCGATRQFANYTPHQAMARGRRSPASARDGAA